MILKYYIFTGMLLFECYDNCIKFAVLRYYKYT